jgi:hypothetical protein
MWNLTATQPPLQDGLSTSEDVRRLADELELETHLAGMSARDRWRLVAPRLAELEGDLEQSGHQLTDSIRDELALLYTLLHDLQVEVN